MALRKFSDLFLHILYPEKCPVCQVILPDRQSLLCPGCQARIRPPGEPRCLRCRKPLMAAAEYCRDCAGGKRLFTEGMGVFLYDGEMKRSILRFKLQGHRVNARFYARAMAVYGRECLGRWRPDLIVAVPMYPSDQRRRGFNQAQLLAEELSACTGLPCPAGLVVKVKKTSSQKTLDAMARRRNLAAALRVTRRVDGLRILIVDDVFTTGSTIDAVAGLLLAAGARDVFFMTVCIGKQ